MRVVTSPAKKKNKNFRRTSIPPYTHTQHNDLIKFIEKTNENYYNNKITNIFSVHMSEYVRCIVVNKRECIQGIWMSSENMCMRGGV